MSGSDPRLRTAILVALACTLVGAGCSRRARAHAAADPSPGSNDFALPTYPQGVTVEPVRAQSLADVLEISGRIEADPTRVVRVYPPVSGRLVTVQVRPADHVQRGEVLAILVSSDVAAARTAYRQSQADVQVKQQALERSRLLYENHVIALRDYQQARADAAIADATLASAVERLQLLSVDSAGSSDEIVMRAPRDGEVTDLSAAPGEYAKSLDNATAICTIADLTSVWAVGDVYEKDLAGIAIGDAADVVADAYPNEPRHGRVAAISSTVDPTSRTLKVRVVLPNPGRRLKPDMFALIRVLRPPRSVVVVPQAAVIRDGMSAYLFVQVSPGRFERRAVTLGRDTETGRVEVTSGLASGDTVVVEGAELLRAATSS